MIRLYVELICFEGGESTSIAMASAQIAIRAGLLRETQAWRHVPRRCDKAKDLDALIMLVPLMFGVDGNIREPFGISRQCSMKPSQYVPAFESPQVCWKLPRLKCAMTSQE